MSELHPVSGGYQPGYPRKLSSGEIRRLLRPSLLRRFSSRTLIGGMMAAGSAGVLAGCGQSGTGASASTKPKTLPTALTTRSDEKLAAKVKRINEEILGQYQDKAGWNAMAGIGLMLTIPANPPVKTPAIPIMFGNSCVGIFDVEQARLATGRLFDAWGLKLTGGVSIKGEGYEFEADGWNAEYGIGYKINMPEGWVGFGSQNVAAQTEEQKLDEKELQAVSKAVADGKLRLLVVHAGQYPNMDNDLYTPMQYYLATVVDYLNYVHGDHEISKNTVLGDLPGNMTQRSWMDRNRAIPGGDFENADDLKSWSVSEGGKIERTDEWADFGRYAMKLTLPAGGQVTWTLPTPAEIPERSPGFSVGYHRLPSSGTKLDIELSDPAGKTWLHGDVLHHAGGQQGYRDTETQTPPIRSVVKLRIINRDRQPMTVLIDDIGFMAQQTKP